MGYAIYKPNRSLDFYVVWSSYNESPVCWGDCDEVLDFVLETDREKEVFALPRWVAALDRADATGSSSRIANDGWDGNDAYVIFEQRGTLNFGDLKDFVDTYDPVTERFDLSFIHPFEDRDTVRGYDD